MDIAKTFLPDSFAPGTSPATQKAAVGIVKQTDTINGVFEVVAAVALSFLAVRFKHKSLLLTGVGLVLGFSHRLLFFTYSSFDAGFLCDRRIRNRNGFDNGSYDDWGICAVWRRKLRRRAICVAAGSAAYLIGVVIINRVTNFGGWQLNFLLLTLPVAVLGLILSFYALPGKQTVKFEVSTNEKNAYWPTFRRILKNKSAMLYLVGYTISAMVVTGSFAMSFYMQE